MKVLVTGGAGFIGSHVVDGYVARGHEVVVVDDLSSGNVSNINPAARLCPMDIRDEKLDKLFAKEKPDIVNHHAAQISVRNSVDDPLRDASINVLGSINVLNNCVKHGVKKVIYISSGGAIYGEPRYLPCDEQHPIDAFCPYGVTKHTPEHYLFMFNKLYGLKYTVLRYANIYGPRQDPLGEAGVVAIFARQMLRGEPVTINGTGEQERDFVYVGDVAEANMLALESGENEAFNIGCGLGISVNQLFAEMKSLIGYPKDALYGPAKAGETFRIFLTAELASKKLGWRPRHDLRAGLTETIDFFRRQVAESQEARA